MAMNDDGRALVEKMHREAVERIRAGLPPAESNVVVPKPPEAKAETPASQQERALIEKIHREAIERLGEQPLPPIEPRTIHYTELPDPSPDSALFHEWNYYRREVGRLLAEGLEGKFVLIKGEEIIGLFESDEAAKMDAVTRFLMQSVLIHQIRSREPILRVRGYNLPWPISRSQLAQPD
jgi:hypothetical protein